MFVRLWFVVGVLGIACAVGCSSGAGEAAPTLTLDGLTQDELSGDDAGCAGGVAMEDVASLEARAALAMRVVDAVRAGRCNDVDADARVCRSLFLIGLTDPLVGVALGLDVPTLSELAERHRWALEEGVAAAQGTANPALASALGELVRLDVGTALADGPDAVAAVAIERANPSIVEAIALSERSCG